jgi:hypothetical protein
MFFDGVLVINDSPSFAMLVEKSPFYIHWLKRGIPVAELF